MKEFFKNIIVKKVRIMRINNINKNNNNKYKIIIIKI